MLFADEKKVREACAQCMADPADVRAYDDMLTGCRSIGRNFLRLYNIVPPTMTRMINHPYEGTGIINFNKSISEFCNKGKSLDGMICRERRRDVKKVRFAVMYDDSNSMTAWWRKQTLQQDLSEADSPQTYAKVACISLMEGLGRDVEISMWKFGSDAVGPFNLTTNMYRELVASNGSGGSRLDLALTSLIDYGWDKRTGAKVLVILTDGIPEIGRSVYDEDVIVNTKSLEYLHTLIQHNVHVLYAQMLTDESRKFKKSGGFTMHEFGHTIQKLGCEFVNVSTKESLMESLFFGLNKITHKI